jgi:hypothetical protein
MRKSNRYNMSDSIMQHQDNTAAEGRLDELFLAYRDSLPDPVPSANFTPELWARIEAREVSSNLFGRMAKALVTAALAATVILGLMVSTLSQKESTFNGTYLEALSADHASAMEPLNLDRISELEQQ